MNFVMPINSLVQTVLTSELGNNLQIVNQQRMWVVRLRWSILFVFLIWTKNKFGDSSEYTYLYKLSIVVNYGYEVLGFNSGVYHNRNRVSKSHVSYLITQHRYVTSSFVTTCCIWKAYLFIHLLIFISYNFSVWIGFREQRLINVCCWLKCRGLL